MSSNDFTGEAYTLVTPGRPPDPPSPFPRRDLPGTPVGESFERYRAGFAAGEALKRDRTFLSANSEYTRDRHTQIVSAPARCGGSSSGRRTGSEPGQRA